MIKHEQAYIHEYLSVIYKRKNYTISSREIERWWPPDLKPKKGWSKIKTLLDRETNEPK